MDSNKTKWHVLTPSMEDLFLFTISQLLNMDKTLRVNLGDTIITQSCERVTLSYLRYNFKL